MYRNYGSINLSQTEVHDLVDYDPDDGILYTKYGGVINNGKRLTFNLIGKRCRLCEIVYVYMNGPIPKDKKIYFKDGNRYNLKASNIYLL